MTDKGEEKGKGKGPFVVDQMAQRATGLKGGGEKREKCLLKNLLGQNPAAENADEISKPKGVSWIRGGKSETKSGRLEFKRRHVTL